MPFVTKMLFPTAFAYKMKPLTNRVANMGLAFGLWWIWYQYNPIYISLLYDKEKLMWKIFDNEGYEMNVLNDMIPRTWTQEYIHALLRRSVRERNTPGVMHDMPEIGGYVGPEQPEFDYTDRDSICF